MLEFFDNLKTLDDIQALIDDAERESEVLEYKTASNHFDNRDKGEIAKDVPAMANSSGGVIIYGVAPIPATRQNRWRLKAYT